MNPGTTRQANWEALRDAVPLLGPWSTKKGAASTWEDPFMEVTQLNPGRVGVWTISPIVEYLGVA